MSKIIIGSTGFDGTNTGLDTYIINSVAEKSESRVIKDLSDLPTAIGGDIILDKNDGFSRWEFAVLITLPAGVKIVNKGVAIIGLNPQAGLIGDVGGTLIVDTDGLPSHVENMRLSNVNPSGSIFRMRQNSLLLNLYCTVFNCDILSASFVGNFSGHGLVNIRDLFIYQATTGGVSFGDLTFSPPNKIKIDNMLFRDNPNPLGDAVTINASFGAGPYNIESVDIVNSDLYSEVGYNALTVISASNIKRLNVDSNTKFIGTGNPLNGITRNSTGVRIGRDSYYAIYTDTNLSSFPQVIPHGVWTKLTNNKGITQQDLPLEITSLWDSATSKIDCSQLDIGTLLSVKVVVNIESDKIQSAIESRLLGLDPAVTIIRGKSEFMNAQNTKYYVGFYFELPITTQDQIDNGFEIQLDATDPNNSVLTVDFMQLAIKTI